MSHQAVGAQEEYVGATGNLRDEIVAIFLSRLLRDAQESALKPLATYLLDYPEQYRELLIRAWMQTITEGADPDRVESS
jgi:hypothetical protein